MLKEEARREAEMEDENDEEIEEPGESWEAPEDDEDEEVARGEKTVLTTGP